LFGCSNTNQEGVTDRPNDRNIEQTRFNDGTNTDLRDSRTNNRETRYNDDRFDRKNNNMSNERTREKDENQYEVSKEAADKIVDDVKEINHAYVLTTKNNAYVAATLNNHDDNEADQEHNNNRDHDRNHNEDLTDDLKNEISDIVRSIDNDIDNVYVSTNPDFVDLATNYADNMENGRPVRGFFDQIGNMIE